MQMSEQIDKLAAALCKAQSELKSAIKDAKNPFFNSTYADYAAVWEACKDALKNNGLAISQVGETTVIESVSVTTILMHTSGQYIAGTINMRPVKADPQGVGSCITYARRYGLQAILGIVSEDDDANYASDKHTGPPAYGSYPKPAHRREPQGKVIGGTRVE